MINELLRDFNNTEFEELNEIEEIFLKEGFNKRNFMGRVVSFSRKDDKDYIVIGFSIPTECVNFMVKPEDPELYDTDIHLSLHLFCRLFKESKDLNSFFNTLKRL